MSAVRSHGNRSTELAVVGLFRVLKITGWRRRQKIFGRPDFTLRKERVLVFVDGCFWHGCPKHSRLPETNRAFWTKKLSGNKVRDRMVNHVLRKAGWTVVRIWEHEFSKKNLPRLLAKLTKLILAHSPQI